MNLTRVCGPSILGVRVAFADGHFLRVQFLLKVA